MRPLPLLLLSAVALLVLGVGVQTGASAYDRWCRNQKVELPLLTKQLLSLGSHHSSPLMQMVCWFWWPMLWVGLRCHRRYPSEADFALRFVFVLLAVWLILCILLAAMLWICVAPWESGLWPIASPGVITWLVPALSWLLPILVIVDTIRLWRNRRTLPSNAPQPEGDNPRTNGA